MFNSPTSMRVMLCVAILSAALLSRGLSAQTHAEDIAALEHAVKQACPKQWEDLFTDIEIDANVLDVWQGDLTDKSQFIQYANEVDDTGKPRLLDDNGKLLIDSYSDVVTIMAECGAQRVTYYKTIRQHIGTVVRGMVSQLEGQTAFNRPVPIGGVDYSDWIDGSTTGADYDEVDPTNIAMGRNTTQSGTSSDELSDVETERSEEEYGDLAEKQGYAVKAVDNDTDGNFVNNSVTHTGFQDQPYWQVDLDRVRSIESIKIYNRTDCCTDRLSGFSILIGTAPIDARKLDDAKALDGVTAVFDGETGFTEESKTFEMPPNTRGRYVRIQLAGDKTVLSLAEVQVIGR